MILYALISSSNSAIAFSLAALFFEKKDVSLFSTSHILDMKFADSSPSFSLAFTTIGYNELSKAVTALTTSSHQFTICPRVLLRYSANCSLPIGIESILSRYLPNASQTS